MKLWHVQAEGMDGQIAVSVDAFIESLIDDGYKQYDVDRGKGYRTVHAIDDCDIYIEYFLIPVEVIGAAE